MLCDAHCHFFSSNFFRTLGRDAEVTGDAAVELPARLKWDAPGDDHALADRWIAELDKHDVARAMLIASVPGDEGAVAAAVKRHPSRLVGAFMINPAAPDAASRAERAFTDLGLRTACLFPAMTHVPVDDERSAKIFAIAERHQASLFVHCGVLSVGVRKKLGLESHFDVRLGDPLAVAAVAVKHPGVPVIIPHFGAGMFREALMAAQTAPNVLLDTSSSNSWISLYPGLTLRDVFERALAVVGANRLLFGSDSSFFPRGWQSGVHSEQRAILSGLGVDSAAQDAIFGGNFSRL